MNLSKTDQTAPQEGTTNSHFLPEDMGGMGENICFTVPLLASSGYSNFFFFFLTKLCEIDELKKKKKRWYLGDLP